MKIMKESLTSITFEDILHDGIDSIVGGANGILATIQEYFPDVDENNPVILRAVRVIRGLVESIPGGRAISKYDWNHQFPVDHIIDDNDSGEIMITLNVEFSAGLSHQITKSVYFDGYEITGEDDGWD